MNHQPFEDWLLDDEQLTMQQRRELQIHLRSCTRCSGIAASNLALRSGRLAEPAPGFVGRFLPRLTAWQRQQARRQVIGTVVLVLSGLALLYTLAGPAVLEAIRDPAGWVRDTTLFLVSVLSLARVASQVGGTMMRGMASLVPPPTGWGLLFVGFGIVALWISMVRRLARAPRGA